MSAILFAPHNDDETLFTFYNLLRYKPDVVIVLRSHREFAMGGPTYVEREAETGFAMRLAGVDWEQWRYADDNPDWDGIEREIRRTVGAYDTIIAPAYEVGGHEDHNGVAEILNVYEGNVIRYLSYVRGHGRSEGVEVVPTPEEAALKAQALACYPSQAAYPPTAPWFGPDQREFTL